MGIVGSALLAAVVAAAGPADTIVPLSVVSGRLLVVPVRLDDTGPFEFLLDTGADATVVDASLAPRLGLEPRDLVSLVGPGGTVVVPRARLGRLTVGPKSVEALEVLCADLSGLRRLGVRIVGVLGQDVLGRFDYLLSYEQRHLRFDPDDVIAGARVPFERHDGRMVVEVALGKEGDVRRFVLDSGASSVFVFDRPSLGASVRREDGSVEAYTFRGARRLRPSRIGRLAVGGQELVDLLAVLVDDPQRLAASSEDGLLPTSLFASVYFDNADRFVLLERRP
jgi:predicted aspartyl protease